MTTTSFMIDKDGHLVVNQANLDRDPPNENRLSFQVFVRELIEDGPKSSIPLTITVNLKDVNDNAPIMEPVRDISLVAGNNKRKIVRMLECHCSLLLVFNLFRIKIFKEYFYLFSFL